MIFEKLITKARHVLKSRKGLLGVGLAAVVAATGIVQAAGAAPERVVTYTKEHDKPESPVTGTDLDNFEFDMYWRPSERPDTLFTKDADLYATFVIDVQYKGTTPYEAGDIVVELDGFEDLIRPGHPDIEYKQKKVMYDIDASKEGSGEDRGDWTYSESDDHYVLKNSRPTGDAGFSSTVEFICQMSDLRCMISGYEKTVQASLQVPKTGEQKLLSTPLTWKNQTTHDTTYLQVNIPLEVSRASEGSPTNAYATYRFGRGVLKTYNRGIKYQKLELSTNIGTFDTNDGGDSGKSTVVYEETYHPQSEASGFLRFGQNIWLDVNEETIGKTMTVRAKLTTLYLDHLEEEVLEEVTETVIQALPEPEQPIVWGYETVYNGGFSVESRFQRPNLYADFLEDNEYKKLWVQSQSDDEGSPAQKTVIESYAPDAGYFGLLQSYGNPVLTELPSNGISIPYVNVYLPAEGVEGFSGEIWLQQKGVWVKVKDLVVSEAEDVGDPELDYYYQLSSSPTDRYYKLPARENEYTDSMSDEEKHIRYSYYTCYGRQTKPLSRENNKKWTVDLSGYAFENIRFVVNGQYDPLFELLYHPESELFDGYKFSHEDFPFSYDHLYGNSWGASFKASRTYENSENHPDVSSETYSYSSFYNRYLRESVYPAYQDETEGNYNRKIEKDFISWKMHLEWGRSATAGGYYSIPCTALNPVIDVEISVEPYMTLDGFTTEDRDENGWFEKEHVCEYLGLVNGKKKYRISLPAENKVGGYIQNRGWLAFSVSRDWLSLLKHFGMAPVKAPVTVADGSDFSIKSWEKDWIFDISEPVTRNLMMAQIAESTFEGVTKLSSVNGGRFSSDSKRVEEGSDYAYRLRLASSQNAMKNMVLYDRLETAEGADSVRWQGDFAGVDTSVMDSILALSDKKSVVWYSTATDQELDLSTSGWTKAVDYTGELRDVKAIAVDFGDFEAPEGAAVFADVQMRANESLNTGHAYNDYCASYLALKGGKVLENRTGIPSNVVELVGNLKDTVNVQKVWNDHTQTLTANVPSGSGVTASLYEGETLLEKVAVIGNKVTFSKASDPTKEYRIVLTGERREPAEHTIEAIAVSHPDSVKILVDGQELTLTKDKGFTGSVEVPAVPEHAIEETDLTGYTSKVDIKKGTERRTLSATVTNTPDRIEREVTIQPGKKEGTTVSFQKVWNIGDKPVEINLLDAAGIGVRGKVELYAADDLDTCLEEIQTDENGFGLSAESYPLTQALKAVATVPMDGSTQTITADVIAWRDPVPAELSIKVDGADFTLKAENDWKLDVETASDDAISVTEYVGGAQDFVLSTTEEENADTKSKTITMANVYRAKVRPVYIHVKDETYLPTGNLDVAAQKEMLAAVLAVTGMALAVLAFRKKQENE